MARKARKWAKHVHVREGMLSSHGYCVRCPTASRHESLRKAVNANGAGEVSRELNFLSNVANRKNNKTEHRIARADQRWVKANFEDGKSRAMRE